MALNMAVWFSGCGLSFELVGAGFESRHVLLLFALNLKIQMSFKKVPSESRSFLFVIFRFFPTGLRPNKIFFVVTDFVGPL